MTRLYSLCYRPIFALTWIAAWCLVPFSRKIRAGLLGRRGLVARVKAARLDNPYWFHVASSGELEQCLPLLDRLRAQRPGASIFVSYFSPTAGRALELEKVRREKARLTVPWDYADFSPLDFARSVGPFLSVLSPRAFVAIHREIWPVLTRCCKTRGVPCFLFASFFPPASRANFSRYRHALRDFRFIGTVEEDSARFLARELPGARIDSLGDPRVERVLRRRDMRAVDDSAAPRSPGKIFLAASVWPEDVRALEPAIARMKKDHPGWRLILVPHEPKEAFLAQLEKRLERTGLRSVRWSRQNEIFDENVVVVVDRVGILAELYRTATLVFVGGSFKGRVHNVLEPAAYGRPILTGPFIQNSAEALLLEREDRGLWSSRTSLELADRIASLMSDPPAIARYGRALESYLAEQAGASERYLERLLRELDRSEH